MSKKINFIFKFSKTRKSFIMFFVCWRCWWIIPFITFWTFCKFTDIFISGTCCWFMAQPSWTTEFRANMSRTHFLELTRFLRLDNKGAREKRKSKDNFAAIRGLFKEFNVCLQDAWNLNEEVTIDKTVKSFAVIASSRCIVPRNQKNTEIYSM